MFVLRLRSGKQSQSSAFTLIEVLVGATILVMLVGLVLYITQQATTAVQRASMKIDSFRAARTAYDLIQQKLSQTTLNTYWDYYNAAGVARSAANSSNFVPVSYGRASDLHFLIEPNAPFGQAVFFQAPLAAATGAAYDQTQGLMNACGFFVEFGGDEGNNGLKWHRPSHVSTSRYRYRLMQGVQNTEDATFFSASGSQWVAGVKDRAWPIADNVICLIIWPRLAYSQSATVISSDYAYDSRSTTQKLQTAQLPPIVQVTMIVIDEASAVRLAKGTTEPAAITAALQGRFTDVNRYDDDLEAVKNSLTSAGVNFTTLSGAVTLKESKWSSTP